MVRCSEDTRQEGDPECATTPEIDEWVGAKRIFVRVLNEKVDFKSWKTEAIRQNEIWVPMIPMNSGKFTDSGYRYRRNTFDKNDNWFPLFGPTKIEFYDYISYNSDTFDVGAGSNRIAEIYFRLAVDEIDHTR